MKRTGFLAAIALATAGLGLSLANAGAQQKPIITISSEPHHHLILRNAYVRVFQVKAEPGQTVLLHRHEVDAISIMNADAETTVHAPGKPDVHSLLKDGQIRLQPMGYVHSTEIGSKPYRNVTVELLRPQTNEQNLCADVMAGAPQHCPPAEPDERRAAVPQFQTDQTTITLIRLPAQRQITIADSAAPELIVALDDAPIACKAGANIRGAKTVKLLRHRGDVAWLEREGPQRFLSNPGDKEAWLVTLEMKP